MSFPFAGIVDADNDIPLGPDASVWKQCEIDVVFFKDLYLTQNCLVIEQLFVTGKRQSADDDYAHVGIWKNKHYLYNGHHRLIKSALNGEVGTLARIYKM